MKRIFFLLLVLYSPIACAQRIAPWLDTNGDVYLNRDNGDVDVSAFFGTTADDTSHYLRWNKTGGYFEFSHTLASGGVSFVNGAGAANRLAYWTDADTLSSSANLTYNGTTFTLDQGIIYVTNPTGQGAGFKIKNRSATYGNGLSVGGLGNPNFLANWDVAADKQDDISKPSYCMNLLVSSDVLRFLRAAPGSTGGFGDFVELARFEGSTRNFGLGDSSPVERLTVNGDASIYGGALQVSATETAAAAYNRFGTGTATLANDASDVYATDDVEAGDDVKAGDDITAGDAITAGGAINERTSWRVNSVKRQNLAPVIEADLDIDVSLGNFVMIELSSESFTVQSITDGAFDGQLLTIVNMDPTSTVTVADISAQIEVVGSSRALGGTYTNMVLVWDATGSSWFEVSYQGTDPLL